MAHRPASLGFLLVSVSIPTALLAADAEANVAYLRSDVAPPPWGSTSNEEAMDLVFGAGLWDDLRYESVDPAALFSGTYTFIYLEGSDGVASELQTFLTANQFSAEQWVSSGGHLFVNSAPNEGGDQNWGFTGVTLVFSAPLDPAMPFDDTHPIWNGPFLPTNPIVSGGGYAHAHVTGGGLTPIIIDSDGNAALMELSAYGDGQVLFGGMTTSNFWTTAQDGLNLRANMLWYLGQEDADTDGIIDALDNCIDDANAGQEDVDGDMSGDACDRCLTDPLNDADADTYCADADNCPELLNFNQLDQDGDSAGDACDVCPLDPDNDDDGDTICGDVDNCPGDVNEDQADGDGDGIGDACDEGGTTGSTTEGGSNPDDSGGPDSSGGQADTTASTPDTDATGDTASGSATAGERGDDGGGCGCAAAPPSPAGLWFPAAAAFMIRRRRNHGGQAR